MPVSYTPRAGAPMTDADRFRLLFGPYRTPVFKYGDDAFCELRGGVILCRLTDAPIPWGACGRVRGRPSCGDRWEGAP